MIRPSMVSPRTRKPSTIPTAGSTYATIAAEKANPKHDIWYGGTGDPHLQAAEEGLTQEYKSPKLADMREGAAGLSAILDVEMNLHVKLCAGWGLSPADLEKASPAAEMLAYTRYVLDTGMRGDLLALKVALAPCVIGYAEIATRLASRPDAHAATNPYRVWIAEYAGAPYQEVAAKARAHLEGLADLYLTPAREAELIAIFKEATRLEADFWEMGWRAGKR